MIYERGLLEKKLITNRLPFITSEECIKTTPKIDNAFKRSKLKFLFIGIPSLKVSYHLSDLIKSSKLFSNFLSIVYLFKTRSA